MALAPHQPDTPTAGFRLVRRQGDFPAAAPVVVEAPIKAVAAPKKSWLSRVLGSKK